MFFQCVPLFILPEIILPWMGRNGWFEQGHPLRWLADQLFERYDGAAGHERAYWRSYGFILAWPLNVYNVFTDHPLWLWLGISFVQTFVFIPLIIWRWGKGAYCGWICSCGALAETLGDAHRQKMPHGPVWNRVNMLGQATLAFATTILIFRIAGWMTGPESFAIGVVRQALRGHPVFELLVVRGHPHGRHLRRGSVLLVQRPDVVPVRVPAGGADAHLRALQPVPHFRRKRRSASRATSAPACATRAST